MTDHPTDPTDPRDDLASAHLDGQTSPDEARRIASDPDLTARVAAFAAVRAAVGAATGPGDADRRELAIAAAMAAAGPALGADAPVFALADAARRRSTRRRLQLVAVAAAVVIAVAVPVLSRRGHHPTDRLASAPGSTTTTVPSAAKEAATAGPAADSGAATMAAPTVPPVGLGAFPDLAALASAARAQLAGTSSTTLATPQTTVPAPQDPAAQGCLDAARRTAEEVGQVAVLSGTATLGGRSVAVTVTEAPDGRRVLTAVDPAAGCATVGTEVL